MDLVIEKSWVSYLPHDIINIIKTELNKHHMKRVHHELVNNIKHSNETSIHKKSNNYKKIINEILDLLPSTVNTYSSQLNSYFKFTEWLVTTNLLTNEELESCFSYNIEKPDSENDSDSKSLLLYLASSLVNTPICKISYEYYKTILCQLTYQQLLSFRKFLKLNN
tara:strand:- start:3085 stop:3582 length:498 start_codon:yes stop_codon:yes gene_type:complete